MRKNQNERSGSRGPNTRPTGMPVMSNTGSGFYRYNDQLQNP